MKKNISIIGLGKLGASIAVALASRNCKVIGVDISKKLVEEINSGTLQLHEVQFEKLFKKHKKNITATTNYKEAISQSDISLIIVPTPSKKNGLFDNACIKRVLKNIVPLLRKKEPYHIISILSTIIPGSMEKEIQPFIEKGTKKKIGENIGLCYNPSFIALGTVIKNFLEPDFVLIGESDKKAGDKLEQFYKKICTNKPPIKRMNFVNAEITKLALNTFVTTKISYANMLAELCEHIPKAHVDIVTNALGYDRRIGHAYLKGATSYGGPCFPRDNKALTATGKKYNTALYLPQTTDKINQKQINRLISLVKKHTPQKGNITILGSTYQSGSDVTEEAASVKLITILNNDYRITVYDPIGIHNIKSRFKKTIQYASSLKEAIKNANAIIVATNLEVFKNIKPADIKNRPFLVDCWRIIDSQKLKSMVEYYPLGVGPIATR